MKRFIALLTSMTLAFAGLTLITAGPASAKIDRRQCVSKPEFRQVFRGMMKTRVGSIFDVPGYRIHQSSTHIPGYTDYYEDIEYYDYDGDGFIDESWEWDYVEIPYWVPGYSLTDWYMTYGKCKDKNFDRGRGRVAINFDNYTSPYSGMRVFSKFRNNPWSYLARTSDAKAGARADKSAAVKASALAKAKADHKAENQRLLADFAN